MKMKVGQMVSVWHKDSGRHKWRCEYSMVRIVAIWADGVTVQKSETYAYNWKGGYAGATYMGFSGVGKWRRELRKPVYSFEGGVA